MKSSVEKLNDTRVKVTVEVPFEELSSEFDQAYKAIAQQVQVPGFRKGKAPRQLIDARFGRGPVIEQVVNDMLPSRYSQAVEENELVVLGQPEINITKIEDGELVEFVAEVDVRPEITLPSFEDINVEVPPLKVEDAAVEKELEELRSRFGTLKTVERAAQEGDFVSIDLHAEVDGEVIEDSKTEGMSYNIGSDDLIKGLDEALTGLSVGESTSFESELHMGEHAGEQGEITVTLQSVKERELPEVDDEFAMMASEFDTVDELRESLEKKVEEDAKGSQAAAIRDEVLSAALSQSEFPLPEGVVEEQVKAQRDQLLQQVGGDEKILDTLLEAQGTSREKFDEDARTSAEDAVRNQLFLDRLAEELEPEVTEQEMSDHIMFTAQRYGMEPAQFFGQLQQSGQLGALFADVRRGKALAEAICKVSVKDTEGNEVDPAQYFGDEEPESESEAESE